MCEIETQRQSFIRTLALGPSMFYELARNYPQDQTQHDKDNERSSCKVERLAMKRLANLSEAFVIPFRNPFVFVFVLWS